MTKAIYYFNRLLATLTGFCLLAASTFAVTHGEPFALQNLTATALAFGVAIASALAPRLQAGYIGSGLLALLLIGGEAHNLIRTTEQAISVRQVHASIVVTNNKARELAETTLDDASKRLDKAEAAKKAADATVAQKNSTKDCKAKCMAGNITQADKAAGEVTAARKAVEDAKQQLASVPADLSPNPLADTTGIAAWKIDLASGGLLALCLNMMAALLIVLGNRGSGVKQQKAAPAAKAAVAPALPQIRVATAAEEAARAAEQRLRGLGDWAAVQPAPAVEAAPAAPAASAEIIPMPPTNGGTRKKVSTKARAEADVIELVARGEPLPSQATLAYRWDVNTGTASKWLTEFERRGVIHRQQEGKRKQVLAAVG